jgi:pyruvate ferredoxin oxidoreductase alpha subunit
MAVRDAGWVQLYCADNQEAVDTTIQAFRIAERCELPVMVCVDGFTLTHCLEPLIVPDQAEVDAFLPPFSFSRALDSATPLTAGTLVSPDYFAEARHAHHQALLKAGAEIEAADRDWAAVSGRVSGGLVVVEGDADARVGLLTLGSLIGTLADARAAHPELGPARLIRLRAFRPFPTEALQRACQGLDDVVVLERALSPGAGGIVAAEVRGALSELADPPRVHAYAVGLGGRDMPLAVYGEALARARDERPERFAVLDLVPERLPMEDR